MDFHDLNNDQRREKVNSEQRFAAYRAAVSRAGRYRGSFVWQEVKGETYLARSYYDRSGKRRQTSLGRRSAETERRKEEWERGRSEALADLQSMRETMTRQAAVNRALSLGRVPMIGARIIRALEDAGLLGNGIRIVGTNAIYTYEAAAGVMVDPGITATQDIDLLMDARQHLRMAASAEVEEPTLLGLLHKVDKSFKRTAQAFRAVNREGYLVDLIRPQRSQPWVAERERIGADARDLSSVAIEGLGWHENAPDFEAVAIDERGAPLRIVSTDPRVFAAHKLWVSSQPGREPIKRQRDAAQARAVAAIVATHMPHLPYEWEALRMIPRKIFDRAAPLFTPPAGTGSDDPYAF
ncbi:nucleotidyltransferase domain-containing protein [Mesorhizobium sp. CAU 1732]|uniref:nucleotidyltransferase domain-containing protein n=1 Tax=Mesorhizobium sp. CAU 1732 TaxID=3140358 RepID=UPI00326056D0